MPKAGHGRQNLHSRRVFWISVEVLSITVNSRHIELYDTYCSPHTSPHKRSFSTHEILSSSKTESILLHYSTITMMYPPRTSVEIPGYIGTYQAVLAEYWKESIADDA